MNIYCGYGHKLNSISVDPNIPPEAQEDPKDPDEQPEVKF